MHRRAYRSEIWLFGCNLILALLGAAWYEYTPGDSFPFLIAWFVASLWLVANVGVVVATWPAALKTDAKKIVALTVATLPACVVAAFPAITSALIEMLGDATPEQFVWIVGTVENLLFIGVLCSIAIALRHWRWKPSIVAPATIVLALVVILLRSQAVALNGGSSLW